VVRWFVEVEVVEESRSGGRESKWWKRVEVVEESRRGEVGGEVVVRCLFGGSVWSSWKKRGEGSRSWLVVRGEVRAK